MTDSARRSPPLALAAPRRRALSPRTRPQSLPKIRLNAGIHNIDAQLAQTPEQREIGLMFRASMPANEGMLFAFERPAQQCFWMKNTLLPLDDRLRRRRRRIVNIEQHEAADARQPLLEKPVRYVLEMNDGWFAKRGIKPGFKLKGLPTAPLSPAQAGGVADPARGRRAPQAKFFAAKSQLTSEPRKVSAHFGRGLR